MYKILLAFALLLLSSLAFANKNIALVIGNENYSSSTRLYTPINDAKSIADKLRRIGFHVALKIDIRTRNAFLNVLRDFANESQSADIALIYYAGHSIEAWGEFYLLPTNARLIRSAQDLTTLVNYSDLETAVSGAKLTGILSLDACRSNPLDGLKQPSNARAVFNLGLPQRGLPDTRGLKRVHATSSRPANLLISFATAPNYTAIDQYKDSNHSPYAYSLLKELDKPQREIGEIFRSLRSRVMRLTSNRQRPETHEERDARRIILGFQSSKNPRRYLSAPRKAKVRYLNGVSIDTGRY